MCISRCQRVYIFISLRFELVILMSINTLAICQIYAIPLVQVALFEREQVPRFSLMNSIDQQSGGHITSTSRRLAINYSIYKLLTVSSSVKTFSLQVDNRIIYYRRKTTTQNRKVEPIHPSRSPTCVSMPFWRTQNSKDSDPGVSSQIQHALVHLSQSDST